MEQLTVLYPAGIALIMNLERKYSVYSLEIHTLHSDRMNHSNIRRLPGCFAACLLETPVKCPSVCQPDNKALKNEWKRWHKQSRDHEHRHPFVANCDKLWRRPSSAALNSFLELSVPFLNKTVSHMFIFRCSYIFPVSVWKNYCWHCDPFWSCVMEKYSSARDCSKLSITVPGLGHSMSKTVTDKAVSILSGLQLSLSLDRQTPLSHPGDWVTHKIFSSA